MKFSRLVKAVAVAYGISYLPLARADGSPLTAEAQFDLARKYLKGEGVPRDEHRAFDLMKTAADQGNADALGGVGYFYATGHVVVRNEQEAIGWFRKGAESGSLKAQFNLGRMMVRGTGGSKNATEGIEWIQKAADHGLIEAAIFYGNALYFGKHGLEANARKSFLYLLQAAESGEAESQNTVGVICEYPQGEVAPDLEQAEKWYRKAALQGHAKAQSNLGHLLGPDGPEADKRTEALSWLMLSAGQGDTAAQKTLHEVLPHTNQGDAAEARKLATRFTKAPSVTVDTN